MPDPNTVNVALLIPNRGADVGVWDVPLNGDFSAIDGFFGGTQTISVSNSNITLTAPPGSITPSGGPTQSQNAMLIFTGAMTGNVKVTLPLPGYMAIANFTTGAFVLTFAAANSGLVVAVEQGTVQRIVNNGTNVQLIGLPPVGSYLDTCDGAVPAWINACSVPPYLLCNGGTFSQVTYPYLYAKLGNSTTLPDGRGRSRYMLSLGTGRLTNAGAGIDGTTALSSGGDNGVSLAAGQIPSLTSINPSQSITVNPLGNSGLFVPTSISSWFGVGTNVGGNPAPITNNTGSIGFTSSFSGSNSISVTYTNGSQSVVQSTTPGYVGGITMIRAA